MRRRLCVCMCPRVCDPVKGRDYKQQTQSSLRGMREGRGEESVGVGPAVQRVISVSSHRVPFRRDSWKVLKRGSSSGPPV